MHCNFMRTLTYEEALQEKTQDFQGAQSDAAWLRQWLGYGVNRLGYRLTIWGQRLQALGTTNDLTSTIRE